jgi:hypothetical protein
MDNQDIQATLGRIERTEKATTLDCKINIFLISFDENNMHGARRYAYKDN